MGTFFLIIFSVMLGCLVYSLAKAVSTHKEILGKDKAKKHTDVKTELIMELNGAVENENYEEAAKLRDKIKRLG